MVSEINKNNIGTLQRDKSFFEEWAEDYDERRNKSFLEKSKLHMSSIVDKYLNNNLNFLEIGLGTGEVFELISSKFKATYGMDVSEGMVRRTYSKEIDKKKLFVGDACNIPTRSDFFDFIICQDVLEHVPHQDKMILEICRTLKKGGNAIITTPNPLWSPVLYVAEKLKLKVEEGEHKFVFLSSLVKKTIKNSNCHVVSSTPFMMVPIKSSMDEFLESLSSYGFLSKLAFSQMCIITKT